MACKISKKIQLPYSWDLLPYGKQYRNCLEQYFATWFPKLSGYQLLKIGGLSGEIKCDLPLCHQIILQDKITKNLTALLKNSHTTFIQADPLNLPFVEKSINGCLLTNILNFSQDPHQILREVQRVCDDEAYLFISLFNPFSALLFKHSLGIKHQQPFFFRHYLSCRIIDWLQLLNFDIIEQKNLVIKNKTALTHR